MWSPWREKKIKREDDELLYAELEKQFTKEQIKEISNAITVSGFYKKNGFFGLRDYKPPIVLFIHDDGDIEVIEDMRAGIVSINVEGEKVRYVLEPRKMVTFPSVDKDNPLRGWILYEGEAQAYPTDPVQDAALFDNILKQFEGLREFDEYGKSGFWKWLTPKMILTIVGAAAILLYVFAVYDPFHWNQAVVLVNQTTNITLDNTNAIGQIRVIP